ncbi:Sorbin and SH3 domain-containing protein 2 [Chytriomyces hyalinus]|nr:Sorbin and SH3 domain-containing protein 2 [Chytriomyces hyalinus]
MSPATPCGNTASVSPQFLQINEGNTTTGPEYAGFPVLTASFPSESAFDGFLGTLSATQVAQSFNQGFGCTAPNVPVLQYQLSFWCSRAAFEAVQAGCQVADATRKSALCAEQCALAQSSVAGVVGDLSGCPTPSTAALSSARANLVSMFATACSNFASAGSSCVAGNAVDVSHCGFLEPAAACAAPANADNVCCQKLFPKAPTASPSPSGNSLPPAASSSASGSSAAPGSGSTTVGINAPTVNGTATTSDIPSNSLASNGINLVVIAGVGVGFVLVLAVCYFAFREYKKRVVKQALFNQYMIEKRPYSTADFAFSGGDDGAVGGSRKYSNKSLGDNSRKGAIALDVVGGSNNKVANLMSGVPDSIKSPTTMSASHAANNSVSRSGTTKVVRVVHPYRAVLNDELTLVVGCDVVMTKEHNDGWADGIDPVTGARGVFPTTCVMDPEDAAKNAHAKTDFRLSARNSSIYSKSAPYPNELTSSGKPHDNNNNNNNARQSTMSYNSNASTNSNNKTLFRVVHTYKAALDDEMSIIAGNDVIVLQEFDDGWAKGMEPASGKIGLFPMTCVARGNDANSSSKHASVYSKRTSSISRRSIVAAVKEANHDGKDTVVVVHSYDANESDELTLIPGRTIWILDEFDDGWCEGRDPVNNKTGVFPMACVSRNQSANSDARKPDTFAKRRSSVKSISKNETRLRIVHQYAATQSDELTLEVGNDVILIKEFNDGWARGKNPESGKVGMFPMICVAPQ